MAQIMTNEGLGLTDSSLSRLGSYGPKGTAALGQGKESVYINVANGNLVLRQDDGFLASSGLGTNLIQSYNSRGENGHNWVFNIQTRLFIKGVMNQPGSEVMRVDEDGHRSRFIYDPQKGYYVNERGGTSSLSWANDCWSYREAANASCYEYDSEGLLKKVVDRDGHQLQFIYKDQQLERIIDDSGRQTIKWTFKEGLLNDILTISAGEIVHHIHFSYDENNRLRKMAYDLGDGKTYWVTYDYAGDSNWISTIRQSDGSALFIEYDSEGRVKNLFDGENRKTTYDYYQGKTVVTDDLGQSWVYFYDEKGRLSDINSPLNSPIHYEYQNNDLVAVHQGDLHWRFSYNEAGDCIRTEEPSGKIITRIYNEQHCLLNEVVSTIFDGDHYPLCPQASRFVYDELSHLRFKITANGTVTEYRYNQDGRCLNSRTYLLAGYDLSTLTPEQILSLDDLSNWINLQNAQAISLKSYHYDWRGLLDEEVNYSEVDFYGEGLEQNAQITRYHYDAAGRLREKMVPTTNGLITTSYLYDDLGRMIQRWDSLNHCERFEYDDANQRIIETDAKGMQSIRCYDRSGLLLTTQYLDKKQQNYGLLQYRYDEAGHLQTEISSDGQATYYFYDEEGRLKAKCEPGGQLIEYSYDRLNRLVQTLSYHERLDTKNWSEKIPEWPAISPKRSAQDRLGQTIYNAHDQIAYQINAEGAIIAFCYDATGRLIEKTAYAIPLADYQTLQILSVESIKLQASKDDRSYYFVYDEEGRLQAEINGEGSAVAYYYDRKGNLVKTIRYANLLLLPPGAKWVAPKSSAQDIYNFSLYNAAGLKIADIDALGYVITYKYNERGLLIEKYGLATAIKRTELLKINADTKLADLDLQENEKDRLSSYTYDDLDQLIEQRDPNGLITRYSYDEKGLILEKRLIDAKTQELRQQCFRYDSMGRVIQSLDALGAAKLRQGDQLNKAEIDAIWQKYGLYYEYDLAGRVISQTNALNYTSRYFYNEAGLLAYTVNAEGEVTEQHYNSFNQIELTYRYAKPLKGNLTYLTTNELASLLIPLKDENSDEPIYYEYNQLGQLSAKRSGRTGLLTTSYNSFGEIEESSQRIDETHQIVNRYLYDRRGLLVQQIADVGGLNQTKSTSYDQFGRLIKTLEAKGGTTSYTLNQRGERIIIENQARNKKILAYDAFGRILTETDYSHSKYINTYSYDDRNNTITLEHPGIHTRIETQFNAFGDKVKLIDGKGQSTYYHFDAKGQLVAVDNSEGGTQHYSYDQQGNLTWQEDAGGHRIAYRYDALGRMLSKIIDPDGFALTTHYSYDGLGRQLKVIEANGLHKQFSYDDKGNLIKVCVDPNGLNQLSLFFYDDRDLLIKQVEINGEGKNKVTAYEWDSLGRRAAITIDPEGLELTTRYRYDLNDNLISVSDAKNQTNYFIYNAANQCRYQIDARGVVTEQRYDVNGNKIETIIYAHRIPSLTDYSEGEIAALTQKSTNDQYQFYDYDSMGRLTSQFDGLGYATSYIYDANDNLTHIIRYGEAQSLEKLKDGDRGLPRIDKARHQYFAYNSLNQVVYQLDEQKFLTQFNYDESGQVIAKIKFSRSLAIPFDNYSLEEIGAAVLLAPNEDQYIAYAYDQAGRLSYQANADRAVTHYIYDALGNVVSTVRYANLLTPAAREANNWLSEIKASSQDRQTRFIFDLAGREIYRISPEGRVLERRYDSLGNVIAEIAHKVQLNLEPYDEQALRDLLNLDLNSRETDYDYDLAGRLVVRTDANQQKTQYFYDKNSNVLAKIEANTAQWNYSYDEANQLIETRSPIIQITDYEGTWKTVSRSIVTQNIYDSFGNLIETIGDTEGLRQINYFVYDANNRKLQTLYPDVSISAAGNYASLLRQEQGQTLSEDYQYNAFGELIAAKDRAGNWRYKIYDDKGQLLYSLDARGGVTDYTYDAFGNLLAKTVYANRVSLDKEQEVSLDLIKNKLNRSHLDRTESYFYDLDNRLIETRQPAISTYNAQTKHYDKLNPRKLISYNTFGEVSETSVKRNEMDWAKTLYFYNDDGLKIACLDAEHYLSTYSYNNFGELIEEINYSNRSTVWDKLSVQKPEACTKDRHVIFNYDHLGQLTTKTLKQVRYEQLVNGSNRYESLVGDLTTSYTYDALGNLTSTTDPLGFTSYCYYDLLGQLITKVGPPTPAGCSAVSYSYDGLGQLVETIRYADGAIAADINDYILRRSADDRINRSIYDNQGRVLAAIDALNHEIYYSYDANGQVQRSWQLLSQADGSKKLIDKRYSYDKEANLLQTAIYKDNGQLHTEDAQYNSFGELITKGINGKFVTHIDYDNLGRVRRSNTDGYYQIFLYDLTDKLTQIITSTNLFTPEYRFEGVDLSAVSFDETEGFTEDQWRYALQRQNISYDGLGYCLRQTKEFASFDSSSEKDPNLEEVSQVQRVDRWGNILSYTNALGYETRYEYNAFNQVIRQEFPEVVILDEHFKEKSLKPIQYYAYDALGRAIAIRDAKGHTLAKILDAEGKLLAEIDALGNKRLKTYTLFGQLQTSQNELGGLTTYVYDKANRLINVLSPTSQQRFAYDEEDKLIVQTDALNQTLLLSYDNLGNQIQKRDSNGRITSYAYDEFGQKVFEQDAKLLSQSWRYDEQGRLVEHSDLGGHLTTYQYNRNGLLLEEISSTGKHLSYRYQGDGHLSSYNDHAYNESDHYTYDAEGNLTSKSMSRATQGQDQGWKRQLDFYSYDALGRLTSVKREEPKDEDQRFPEKDHDLLNINYFYDEVGNIQRTHVKANYTGYQKLESDDYFSYDANNRMLINKGQWVNGQLELIGPLSSRLSYDAAGNVKEAFKLEDGQLQQYNYRYNSDSQLQEIYKNGRLLKTMQRDALGRVDREFSYDSLGQATQMVAMQYEGGLLKRQTTSTAFLGNWNEVEKNEYSYDQVGNLEVAVSQAIQNKTHLQTVHRYGYEYWDSYLQSIDSAALSINGGLPSFGENRQFYDVNGQLYKTIDNQIDGYGRTKSSDYKISSLDGVLSRIDEDGQRYYLTVAGKSIGDLQLTNDGRQYLNVYGGFTPTGKQQSSMKQSSFLNVAMMPFENAPGFFSRGKEMETAKNLSDNILANTPQDNTGTYTVQAGDSLQSIAFQIYGDSSFWYLIADANGISDISTVNLLHNGQRLIIPAVATRQHQNVETRQLLSSVVLLGDLSPTIPIPESVINGRVGAHGKHHTLFKKIAISAISAVATIIAAAACAALGGALGASMGSLGRIFSLGMRALSGQLLGTAGSLATGFTAGVTGNLVSQGLANALGLQKGINLRSTLTTGLSTAVSAGLLQALNSSWLGRLDKLSPTSLSFSSAAQMMEQDAISQGVSLALQNHQHFDWFELGTKAGLAAVTGGEYGNNLNQALAKRLGEGASSFIQSELSAAATQSMQLGLSGTHFDATQVLTDNLGSSIGAGFMNSQVAMAEQEFFNTSESENTILEGPFCPIPIESEENFSPIPEGSYERFRQERAQREYYESITEKANELWNDYNNEPKVIEFPPIENVGNPLSDFFTTMLKKSVVNSETTLIKGVATKTLEEATSRLPGVAQTGAGMLEMSFAAALIASSSTPVTAAVGYLLYLHGIDNTLTGTVQMGTGEAQETQTLNLLRQTPFSKEEASLIDAGLSLIGSSTVMAEKAALKLPNYVERLYYTQKEQATIKAAYAINYLKNPQISSTLGNAALGAFSGAYGAIAAGGQVDDVAVGALIGVGLSVASRIPILERILKNPYIATGISNAAGQWYAHRKDPQNNNYSLIALGFSFLGVAKANRVTRPIDVPITKTMIDTLFIASASAVGTNLGKQFKW